MIKFRFCTMMLANSRSCARKERVPDVRSSSLERKERVISHAAHLVGLEDLCASAVDPLGVQSTAELPNDEAAARLEELAIRTEQLKQARHQASKVILSGRSAGPVAEGADLGEKLEIGAQDAFRRVG